MTATAAHMLSPTADALRSELKPDHQTQQGSHPEESRETFDDSNRCGNAGKVVNESEDFGLKYAEGNFGAENDVGEVWDPEYGVVAIASMSAEIGTGVGAGLELCSRKRGRDYLEEVEEEVQIAKNLRSSTMIPKERNAVELLSDERDNCADCFGPVPLEDSVVSAALGRVQTHVMSPGDCINASDSQESWSRTVTSKRNLCSFLPSTPSCSMQGAMFLEQPIAVNCSVSRILRERDIKTSPNTTPVVEPFRLSKVSAASSYGPHALKTKGKNKLMTSGSSTSRLASPGTQSIGFVLSVVSNTQENARPLSGGTDATASVDKDKASWWLGQGQTSGFPQHLKGKQRQQQQQQQQQQPNIARRKEYAGGRLSPPHPRKGKGVLQTPSSPERKSFRGRLSRSRTTELKRAALQHSELQLKLAENAASILLNELKEMRKIVEQKLLPQLYANAKGDVNAAVAFMQVKSAVNASVDQEVVAKQVLQEMALSSSVFCSQTLLDDKRLKFADEAGKELCHIRLFHA
eukprot:TRINITY_DN2754_c0_g1_i4.p1 TRINITY_DN2754_c0_g1~~TRINITY_DN2754_c0_g1_i4.p1  ORF type:complete len:520 (-),score=99.03 TRINITY_DN2754_c0_g1_i4:184-1743(-)